MFFVENLKKSPEIRVEEFLEIARRRFRNENSVSFHAPPVRDRARQPSLHPPETNLQILFLTGERRFQYPLENLFVAKLQGLLNSRVRIKSGKSGMVIASTRKIPQRSDVSQASE